MATSIRKSCLLRIDTKDSPHRLQIFLRRFFRRINRVDFNLRIVRIAALYTTHAIIANFFRVKVAHIATAAIRTQPVVFQNAIFWHVKRLLPLLYRTPLGCASPLQRNTGFKNTKVFSQAHQFFARHLADDAADAFDQMRIHIVFLWTLFAVTDRASLPSGKFSSFLYERVFAGMRLCGIISVS